MGRKWLRWPCPWASFTTSLPYLTSSWKSYWCVSSHLTLQGKVLKKASIPVASQPKSSRSKLNLPPHSPSSIQLEWCTHMLSTSLENRVFTVWELLRIKQAFYRMKDANWERLRAGNICNHLLASAKSINCVQIFNSSFHLLVMQIEFVICIL